MSCQDFQVGYGVGGVFDDFRSCRTDNTAKVINRVCKERARFRFQSDVVFFEKNEINKSMVDVVAPCLRGDDYIVKVNKRKLALD